jgi:hypothetical protein
VLIHHCFSEEAYLTRETEAQSLDLKFGTPEEEADMLESIGLQAESLKNYERDHKHIFSREYFREHPSRNFYTIFREYSSSVLTRY